MFECFLCLCRKWWGGYGKKNCTIFLFLTFSFSHYMLMLINHWWLAARNIDKGEVDARSTQRKRWLMMTSLEVLKIYNGLATRIELTLSILMSRSWNLLRNKTIHRLLNKCTMHEKLPSITTDQNTIQN